MQRRDLVAYLDDYLHINQVADYGPQGLQVEAGTEEVGLVAFSTDSALPVIEHAAQAGAQLLVVHHGLFWGAPQPLRGPFGRRVRRLFESGVSLYAAHLALDAHPEVGNNAELARLLDLQISDWWGDFKGTRLAALCQAPDGLKAVELVQRIKTILPCDPLVQLFGPSEVKRVAIVSGSAAQAAAEARSLGADTFVTGETSHVDFYAAQDLAMNIIYAGHYATETLGVQSLARHVAQRFALQTVWLDHPTGL